MSNLTKVASAAAALVVTSQAPLSSALCFTREMTKSFKALAWLYLAAYTVGLLLMLVLDAYVGNFEVSMLVWWIPLLIPAAVLFRALKGNNTHQLFHAVGILALLSPILDAHKFASMEGITLGVYAWFVPMVLAMFYLAYKRAESET